MSHLIPESEIGRHSSGPSASTISSISSLQNAIRDVLGSGYETFLQGSYKNDTSVRDINDVDIIALRKTVVSTVFSTERYSTSVSWEQIFGAIEQALNGSARFRGKVYRGDKCVKVTDTWSVDVVPAVRIQPTPDRDPIAIYSFREGHERQNWPRIHYANGVTKQKATGDRFKPVVRMLKNWSANHWPETNVAPSFYVECLVSNVPDEEFKGDFAEGLFLTGSWVVEHLPVEATTKIMSVARDKDILTSSEWPFAQYGQFHRQLAHSMGLLAKALRATSITEATRLWRLVFNE